MMSYFDYKIIQSFSNYFEIKTPMLNFHSNRLLSSYQKEINEDKYIIKIDNIEKDDKTNEILLNGINYRIEKLNEQMVDQCNTIKNQKLNDMLVILQIYKNKIEKNSDYETILNSLKNNLHNKSAWINKRLENNQKKQLKLSENYEYYKKHLNEEISKKSETKKLLKVKNKMNDFFSDEINIVENRIKLLSEKLSILRYFEENLDKDIPSYINEYIEVFIDRKNKGDLNEILLYLNLSDGTYYDKIRMKKKENLKTSNCVNSKLICEINALMKKF